MGRATTTAVCGLGVAAAGGHVVYPLALWALTARRRPETPPDPEAWPPVSVVVPAYREAGVIGAKVADLRANGYPGAVEVVVVAEDGDTAAVAEATGARVLSPGGRLGKSQAINLGVASASHEVVVLTDANNRLTPGALAALVRWLHVPGVAAVGGEKVEEDKGGEELYWRFESWLKRREALLGTQLGLVGELWAVQRAAWRDIPPDIASDDIWMGVDLAERGHAIAYEPTARSIDPPAGSLRAQWSRRTRFAGGNLYTYWRKRHALRQAPPVVTFQVVGHRLWRYTGGPLAHGGLLLLALSRARRSPVAALFVAGHVAGGAALAGQAAGKRLPTPLAAAAQVLFLQGVAFGGMVRFVRGDHAPQWSKVVR